MRQIKFKREKQQINFFNCDKPYEWKDTCQYREGEPVDVIEYADITVSYDDEWEKVDSDKPDTQRYVTIFNENKEPEIPSGGYVYYTYYMKINIGTGITDFSVNIKVLDKDNGSSTITESRLNLLIGFLDADMLTHHNPYFNTGNIYESPSYYWKDYAYYSRYQTGKTINYTITDTTKEHFIWVCFKAQPAYNSSRYYGVVEIANKQQTNVKYVIEK